MNFRINKNQIEFIQKHLLSEFSLYFKNNALLSDIEEITEAILKAESPHDGVWIIDVTEDQADDIAYMADAYQIYAGFDEDYELNDIGKMAETIFSVFTVDKEKEIT